MNRRGFMSSMLRAGVAFTILPPATTYSRLWKVVEIGGPQINPELENARIEVEFVFAGMPRSVDWIMPILHIRSD